MSWTDRSRTSAPDAHAYRVMIVDDSAVVRGLLTRWIEADGDIEVVRSVGDGAQAVQHLASSGAEVVILDIDMPVMSGIETLPKLLAIQPHVKVLISSTLSRRNAQISLSALSLGAADYMPKPDTVRGVTTSEEFRGEIIAKIRALGAIARGEIGAAAKGTAAATATKKPHRDIVLRAASNVAPKILAVGSSTGGPQALVQLFAALSGRLSVPALVTQHMPPTFTAILAEQLAKAGGAPAKEAEDGEVLIGGRIYVAPGGFHFKLRRDGTSTIAVLDDGPSVNFCRPSVDPMFHSVAALYGPASLGVVLTGMGRDGKNGALAIAEAGGSVLVQDQATSVVWGMPGVIAEAGIACAVLPIDELGPKLLTLLKGRAS